MRQEEREEKMKQTKKDLKELAKALGAYYCGGNVYTHENIEHYLQNGNFEEIKKYSRVDNDILSMIDFLNRVYGLNNFNTSNNRHNLYMISGALLSYSAGVYGNNGQIFKYEIYNNQTQECIYTFYTYYC